MQITVIDSLERISANIWNNLNQNAYPFLRYEFLHALERNQCLNERTGWFPQHLLLYDDDKTLLGAMPLYLKNNSYGEFVFDWSWADAFERHGHDYYPKLVNAIPFTPATGPRLLALSSADRIEIATILIQAAQKLAEQLNCSSLHCLFPDEADLALLRRQELMIRTGCQYHWHNQDYTDFNDFLTALTAKRRKNIRRERRMVASSDIDCIMMSGNEASSKDWATLHQFYANTFFVRGRRPPLTLEFFLDIAASMGEQIILIFAQKQGKKIAGAISYRSSNALYGRHWGCLAEYDSLHFEVCYYQYIDYCIRAHLQRFEPGVQGEHKIWRGFLPRLTYSAHWIAHPSFGAAIGDFLRRETPAIKQYARELEAHSPYRQSGA